MSISLHVTIREHPLATLSLERKSQCDFRSLAIHYEKIEFCEKKNIIFSYEAFINDNAILLFIFYNCPFRQWASPVASSPALAFYHSIREFLLQVLAKFIWRRD